MQRTPNLRGLIALARRDGVDIRPTLLRVITDLFVQEPAHSRDEVTRYTELARHLLENVDEPSRIAVAMKLSRYPDAPREILLNLAADVPSVAQHVLRRASFNEADLVFLADTLRDDGRRILAERVGLPPALAARLRVMFPASAETPRPVAPPLPPVLPATLRSPSAERALAALPPIRTAEFAFAATELEEAALARRSDVFIDRLARTFDLPRDRAEAIVRDPSGQPVAIVCRALDMSSDAFSRVMLFLDPTIGRSVTLVFSLAEYFGSLSVAEAREVVASWRMPRPTPRYVPATAPDGTGRHLPEARRPLAAPDRARIAARG